MCSPADVIDTLYLFVSVPEAKELATVCQLVVGESEAVVTVVDLPLQAVVKEGVVVVVVVVVEVLVDVEDAVVVVDVEDAVVVVDVDVLVEVLVEVEVLVLVEVEVGAALHEPLEQP